MTASFQLLREFCDIPDFDFILSYEWLRKVNSDIDWKLGNISFIWNYYRFWFHTLRATGRISTVLDVTESDTLEFCDWQEVITELKAEDVIRHIFIVKNV